MPKRLQAEPLRVFWGALALVAIVTVLAGAAEAAGPDAEAKARLFG